LQLYIQIIGTIVSQAMGLLGVLDIATVHSNH
jgi:hypothetical protein